MRTTSLFAQIIDKYFQAGTIKKITEKINGEEFIEIFNQDEKVIESEENISVETEE
mgnify:CR=1 FL=1